MDLNTVAKEEMALRLIDDYRNGDEKAFSSLYNMYAVALLNYGMCLTSDKEMVRDCVHDVFVKLLVKCKTSKISKVSSYLFISLRNRLTDEFRRGSFSTDTPINDNKMRRSDDSAEDLFIRQEDASILHADVSKLFAELTPRQRKACNLYFIEQKKYDEICQILQMNYPCVRNLVHRGMMKLRSSETFRQMKLTGARSF